MKEKAPRVERGASGFPWEGRVARPGEDPPQRTRGY
jgi:hypothetical protein